MTSIADGPATLMSSDKAEETAARLNADAAAEGDGWSYRAKHDPRGTGYSLVEVRDETGALLGSL